MVIRKILYFLLFFNLQFFFSSKDEAKFENLKKLAQQVLEFIKQTVGVEEFSMIYSKSHLRRIENKEQRKRNLAQAVCFFLNHY